MKIFEEIKAFWAVWWDSIIKGFQNMWEVIKIGATLAFEVIKSVVTNGLAIMWGVFDVFKGLFTGNWSLMWEGIKTIVTSAWTALVEIVTSIGTAINTYVKEIFWVDLPQAFSDIWDGIYNTASTVFTNIANFISEKVQWIMDKLKQARDALVEIATLGTADTSTYNWARAVWGYTSPNTPYLVGEKWPEIFMPTGSGRIIPNNQLGGGGSISINMWGVQIYNEADENRLIEKMKRMLTQEAKNYNLWIS